MGKKCDPSGFDWNDCCCQTGWFDDLLSNEMHSFRSGDVLGIPLFGPEKLGSLVALVFGVIVLPQGEAPSNEFLKHLVGSEQTIE